MQNKWSSIFVLLSYFLAMFSDISKAVEPDEWLCTEVAAQQINEKNYRICGVGTSRKEEKARKNAASEAFDEFETLCKKNSDCRGFETSVKPLRNQCIYNEAFKEYKCYRGFEIIVKAEKKSDSENHLEQLEKLDRTIQAREGELRRILEEKEKEDRIRALDEAIAAREASDSEFLKYENKMGQVFAFALGTMSPSFNGIGMGYRRKLRRKSNWTISGALSIECKEAPVWSLDQNYLKTDNGPYDQNETLDIPSLGAQFRIGYRVKLPNFFSWLEIEPILKVGFQYTEIYRGLWKNETTDIGHFGSIDRGAGIYLNFKTDAKFTLVTGIERNFSNNRAIGMRTLMYFGITSYSPLLN